MYALSNLAMGLITRFDYVGRTEDLDEAISLAREFGAVTPDVLEDGSGNAEASAGFISGRYGSDLMGGGESSDLTGLARDILAEFNRATPLSSLETSIAFHRDALRLPPALHSECLLSLAATLVLRFRHTSKLGDLDETISLLRDLNSGTEVNDHPTGILASTSAAFLTKFIVTGTEMYRDEAFTWHDLLQTRTKQEVHPRVSELLRVSRQTENIDARISMLRDVLVLLPKTHPARSPVVNDLGVDIHTRFEQAGNGSDLDEAIALHREALGLRHAPNPDRPISLNNLANAIQTRFGQAGNHSDLDEAIVLHREALVLQPTPNPDRPSSLNNLAIAIQARFELAGDHSDLDKAIALHREALSLRPAPHPHRLVSLNNSANAIMTRFVQAGDRSDLEGAIVLHRESINLQTASRPSRLRSLGALATAIVELQTNPSAPIGDAIALINEALYLLPPLHPDQAQILGHLGSLLFQMYDHTHDSNCLDRAVDSFRKAVNLSSASALQRFTSAQLWARHADAYTHASALEAYQHAIEFLPRLSTLRYTLQTRQKILASRSDGLTRNAAACAIQSGEFGRAVESLELGQTMFWSQGLQLRTRLDSLNIVAPELAKRFEARARSLEQGMHRTSSRAAAISETHRMSLDQDATLYRQTQYDWEYTISNIRDLEGFHDFLKPTPLHELQKAASNGPIVMLNAGKYRCDALIVTLAGVDHVPFPNLDSPAVYGLARLTRLALRNLRLSRLDETSLQTLIQRNQRRDDVRLDCHHFPRGITRSEDILASVLESLWFDMIHPVISHLQLAKSTSPSRLWWYPTGPFAFLPIHAAGIYGCADSEGVFDYVISSYTPTLSALLIYLAPQLSVTGPFKMLVAIQPAALPYTLDELHKVEQYVSGDYLVKLGVPEAAASVDNVALHLSGTSIAHFACHGIQGALVLDDSPLEGLRFMKTSILNASLAFLCACETAKGHTNFSDEAIHLAGTMLFAGFRGAVGTMWSMLDADGPRIADSFYEVLSRDLTSTTGARRTYPDPAQAAEALHIAVAKLREEGASISRWAPFVHYGL